MKLPSKYFSWQCLDEIAYQFIFLEITGLKEWDNHDRLRGVLEFFYRAKLTNENRDLLYNTTRFREWEVKPGNKFGDKYEFDSKDPNADNPWVTGRKYTKFLRRAFERFNKLPWPDNCDYHLEIRKPQNGRYLLLLEPHEDEELFEKIFSHEIQLLSGLLEPDELAIRFREINIKHLITMREDRKILERASEPDRNWQPRSLKSKPLPPVSLEVPTHNIQRLGHHRPAIPKSNTIYCKDLSIADSSVFSELGKRFSSLLDSGLPVADISSFLSANPILLVCFFNIALDASIFPDVEFNGERIDFLAEALYETTRKSEWFLVGLGPADLLFFEDNKKAYSQLLDTVERAQAFRNQITQNLAEAQKQFRMISATPNTTIFYGRRSSLSKANKRRLGFLNLNYQNLEIRSYDVLVEKLNVRANYCEAAEDSLCTQDSENTCDE